MPKPAHLTGEIITVFNGDLYRLLCPECQLPQWHYTGTHACIYCGEKFVVTHLKLIDSGEAPEPTEEE